MIPSTLVRIENYPGFLGTFDHISWWKSQTLAGIDTILDVCWIYGEHHICAARMVDGSYTIWQSNDFGNIWNIVLTTSERIYCLLRPDYGRALAGTSGGWWRSENAGRDWTKVSTQAPGCHTVKELTSDILVALDGTYIWRSADTGTTWTKAVITGTGVEVTAITAYPTVDGTSADCFVGCTSSNAQMTFANLGFSGPFSRPSMEGEIHVSTASANMPYKDRLLYSSDGGISFRACEPDSGWAFREATCSSVAGAWFNGWESSGQDPVAPVTLFPRNTYNDIITDIEMTGINSIGLPMFVIQTMMSSGILRHYWARRIAGVGSANKQLWVIPKFDAYNTPGGGITSTEVNIAGTSSVSRMALFSGMGADATPLIKKSITGGETWIDIDPSTAAMYTGPDQLDTTNNAFLEDAYIQYTWSYPLCHNGWHLVSGHYSKRQSYDMSATLADSYQSASASYLMGACVNNILHRTYLTDGRIGATPIKTYTFRGIVELGRGLDYDIDALAEKMLHKTYLARGSIEDVDVATYQMSGLLVDDAFPELVMPQAFRTVFPYASECGVPHDSRNEV